MTNPTAPIRVTTLEEIGREPSMVERVARRLFWMNGQYAEQGMRTWLQATPLVREKFMKEAREAIDEMREPTEAMIPEDGVPAGIVHGMDHYLDRDEARHSWRAMIDAALAEEGKI